MKPLALASALPADKLTFIRNRALAKASGFIKRTLHFARAGWQRNNAGCESKSVRCRCAFLPLGFILCRGTSDGGRAAEHD